MINPDSGHIGRGSDGSEYGDSYEDLDIGEFYAPFLKTVGITSLIAIAWGYTYVCLEEWFHDKTHQAYRNTDVGTIVNIASKTIPIILGIGGYTAYRLTKRNLKKARKSDEEIKKQVQHLRETRKDLSSRTSYDDNDDSRTSGEYPPGLR